jgi:phosphopantothenoylcysteine decarboxylase/phosphopantothenate--cysteine ligase
VTVSGPLSGRTIVIGICGSIAAYKVASVVRRLVGQGADVYVAMTPAAARFIGPVTLRALSRHPVVTDMWAPDTPWDEPHVALGERADIYVIAPATADMIGRLAAGLADDVVSATALATRAPVLLAPAMSDAMAESAAVVANTARLRERGMRVIGPERGALASGRTGLGRMAEPETIVAEIAALLGEASRG